MSPKISIFFNVSSVPHMNQPNHPSPHVLGLISIHLAHPPTPDARCEMRDAHVVVRPLRSTHIARKLDGEGGSPRYMAPECYDASVGKLTDAWGERRGCWKRLWEVEQPILGYPICTTIVPVQVT